MQIKDKEQILKEFDESLKATNNHLTKIEKARILIEQINNLKNNQQGNNEKDMESNL